MRIVLIAGGRTAEAVGTRGSAAHLEQAARALGHRVETLELPADPDTRWAALASARQHDVVLPLVSGLESALELLDVPYVGSPPDAAALAANKATFNTLLTGWGLRTVPWEQHDVGRDGVPPSPAVPGPWYVKPARLGASYGISRVDAPGGLDAAVRAAADHDSLVLIEQEVPRPFIEVEVAAIVGASARISPPMEIRAPGALWRDPRWKYSLDELPVLYQGGAAQECLDAVRLMIERSGVAGAVRFDLFVSRGPAVFVGEVNALPGHGAASTFPRIFELAGVSRPEQLEMMLEAAVRNHSRAASQRVRG